MTAPEYLIIGQLASIATALVVPVIKHLLRRLVHARKAHKSDGPPPSSTEVAPEKSDPCTGVRDEVEEKFGKLETSTPGRTELLLGQINLHFLLHARRTATTTLVLSIVAFLAIIGLEIEVVLFGQHQYASLAIASPVGLAACVVTLFHRQSNRSAEQLREQARLTQLLFEEQEQRRHQLELIVHVEYASTRDSLITSLLLESATPD